MTDFSRRNFFKTAALPVGLGGLATATAAPAPVPAAAAAPAVDANALRWLDGSAPELMLGATLGLPWPRGQHRKDQVFHAADAQGQALPLQTWPLAWWPDGSLKWTAHALPAGIDAGAAPSIRAGKGTVTASAKVSVKVSVKELADAVEVDTGVIRCKLPRQGSKLIHSIERDGREILRGCTLVAQTDDKPDAGNGPVTQTAFDSRIAKLTVEQTGPVRVVVKVDGQHRSAAGREWLPFSVRFYFYAGAESVRVMHTFVFDGDDQKDFLRGIGLRFEVPLRDALYDLHVRFAGEAGGLWAEGVRNLTGLRRDPGAAVREAQLAGRATPPLAQWKPPVAKLQHRIPAWGDYTLSQLSADGFQIKKRTQPGHGWIPAAFGKRAPGSGYIGGATGGVAFGLRDFWQRHPVQLDIRNALTDAAQVTLWMHSPDAPAMDLRFYHDGLGMETHAEELEGLEITYEDYEKGFGTPVGIARSSEITLWALAATPTRERLVQMAAAVQAPPQLAAHPSRYLQAGVFGKLWSLPDRGTPARVKIENKLDFLFDYYAKQIEQRHWYGFWDYGDFRHTYDADRHEWRYDVGGFAWDNSELSTDIWLWYAFLRSGRADIFRVAEAMTRHTSEVDIYHAGRFQGLGTRHNVQHWGCSAKQARISTSANRRFYYYLTADERIGDVMREVLDNDQKLDEVDPVRKIAGRVDKGPWPARIGFGTDWGSIVANVMTEWERTGDVRWRNKLLRGMQGIAAMPHGFFTGSGGYEPTGPNEGALHNVSGDKMSASHLSAVFGGMEMMTELAELIDEPAFKQAWVQYCEFYNAPRDQQVKALGAPHGGGTVLSVGHSRLTAYAAVQKQDAALAQRAWKEFWMDDPRGVKALKTVRVAGPLALNAVDEAAWISTNDTAQWGLAAIQNLALVGDQLKD